MEIPARDLRETPARDLSETPARDLSETPAGRVAVLSDIHAVMPALAAVLAEPDVAAADLIVLTGDVAAGPQPVETLDRLAELGERAVWIRGNADRELVEFARRERTDMPDGISAWAADELRLDQVEFLSRLPLTRTVAVTGLGEVLFCHATPRDDEEVVLVDSRLDRWQHVFDDVQAEVAAVVCGHTHMPYIRLAHGRLVINPGSVGMPYGRAGAHWALLGPGAELRRTAFDADAACKLIAAESGFPQARAWADDYLRGRITDADALAVIGPRDGRAAR
jgi:predicted phosphodiesterase